MQREQKPRQGEIYDHFKGKPYQIITVATHSETGESMVVYQAMYGDFKTYVRPLSMFMSEVDRSKYPEATQKYRFELRKEETNTGEIRQEEPELVKQVSDGRNATDEIIRNENTVNENTVKVDSVKEHSMIEPNEEACEEGINEILLKFLDASSYTKKLEIITSNTKHLTDRLINDMAVSLDCTVEDGTLEQRIKGLEYCLQAMRRFENRRLR